MTDTNNTHHRPGMTPPASKLQAAGYSGAASIVLIWLLASIGIDIPAEVASAITLLISGLAAWIKRERITVEPYKGRYAQK